ncbi:DUF1801 domain-containing protein [Candidatus Saccharibacteria bacterium]|nr:MAG: DUF1801 domain-containing protein [Candidatus Saccharibacteria bacterium]
MLIKARSFAEYFDKAGTFGPELAVVDSLIRLHAPDMQPVLFPTSGGVSLGYGEMQYQPKSAKTPTTWPVLALAAQKHYMALYACAIVDDQYVAEKYAPELGKVNVGKSCIRFKRLSDIHEEALMAMLEDINMRYKNGELHYSQW